MADVMCVNVVSTKCGEKKICGHAIRESVAAILGLKVSPILLVSTHKPTT